MSFSPVFSIRLDEHQDKKVKSMAKERGISANKMVKELVLDSLEKNVSGSSYVEEQRISPIIKQIDINKKLSMLEHEIEILQIKKETKKEMKGLVEEIWHSLN